MLFSSLVNCDLFVVTITSLVEAKLKDIIDLLDKKRKRTRP